MKKLKILILCVILCAAAVPYLRVELLTYLHGDDFADADTMKFMISNAEYFKIYKYTKDEAKVFFVEKDKEFSVMAYFYKDENGEWAPSETWECIWSKQGSASEFIWPYYR